MVFIIAFIVESENYYMTGDNRVGISVQSVFFNNNNNAITRSINCALNGIITNTKLGGHKSS